MEPLGRREDLHVEFKGADVLGDLSKVARSVVGFLNAEGGTLWIGVRENDEVADGFEAIEAPAGQARRVQDALLDLVEPPPRIGRGRDVGVEVVPIDGHADRGLLRITVTPGGNGPYALLRKGDARSYLIRSGSRLRSMTREEIGRAFGAFGAPRGGDPPSEAMQALFEELGRAPARIARSGGLRMLVRPLEDLALDLRAEDLRPFVESPQATGNRRFGWNFTGAGSLVPEYPDALRYGERDSIQWLWISSRGEVEFNVSLERLYFQREPGRMSPLALLELPASILRLVAVLYGRFGKPPPSARATILAGLGLFKADSVTLSPGSPTSLAWQLPENAHTAQLGEIPAAVSMTWEELSSHPDAGAFRLVKPVYRAFGFEEDALPPEYDRRARRLVIPD